MREPPADVVSAAFPRPGRTLKAVLATIAIFAVAGAIFVNWGPKAVGHALFDWLAFRPEVFLHRPWMVWTLFTSGVLTFPVGISHALWSIVGLYFLTTDLERRWGGARLIRFLVASTVVGNLVVLGVSAVPFGPAIFHPEIAYGPMAAITATAIAWAKENRHTQIRLFFFLPVSGRILFWVTIGFSIIALVFLQGSPEGAVAPFGGVIAGMLFGGSPSAVRSTWLKLKLTLLRRRGESLKAELARGPASERPRSKRGGKGPPLRVVYGGLEEDLKNRKPPKDKRYLN